MVTYNDNNGIWDCDCCLGEKIGLPCAHALKIILLRKEKIVTAINPWWLQTLK